MPLSRLLAVGAGNTGAPAFRAAVLWDSGCLAVPIAAAYPLKPCGTTALVSLGEGDVGPPRKGCIAGGCLQSTLTPVASQTPCQKAHGQHVLISSGSAPGSLAGCAEPPSYLTAYLDPGGATQGGPQRPVRLLARRPMASAC